MLETYSSNHRFFDALSIDELYHRFAEPEKIPITQTHSASLGPEASSYSIQLAYVGIKIADFGGASSVETARKHSLHIPILFRPRKFYFSKGQLGLLADVWSLVSTLYEILGERPLFGGFMPDVDNLIAEVISNLSPLVQHWWDSWQKRSDFGLEDEIWTTATKCIVDRNSGH